MNRRRLLATLPVASLALIGAAAAQTNATPELSIDTRPSFKRSDYVLWDPGTPHVCVTHQADHGVYTHGCQPMAFLRARQLVPDAQHRPVTANAIPADLTQDCPVGRVHPTPPHQHDDFRWEDA